jgi:hypothetical protein
MASRTRRTRPVTATGVAAEEMPEGTIDLLFAVTREAVPAEALTAVGALNMAEAGIQIDGEAVCHLITAEGRRRLEAQGWRFTNPRNSRTNGIDRLDARAPAADAVAVPPASAAPQTPAAPVAAAPAAPAAPAQAAPAAAKAGVVSIKIGTKAAADVKVNVLSWQGADGSFKSKFIEMVKSILGEYVKRDINLYVPNARAQAPNDANDEFNVYIWSAPESGGPDSRFLVPRTLWGLTPPHGAPGHFIAWDKGAKIVTDEGDEVGYFNHNNLYVCLDIVEQDSPSALEFCRTYLTKSVSIMKNGYRPPNWYDHVDKYVKVCLQRDEQAKKQAADNLKKEQDRARQARQQYIDAVRQAERCERLMSGEEHSLDERKAKLTKEFVNLREIAFIESVNFKGNSLVIETDPLYVEDPRTKKLHALNRFRITIDPDEGRVRMATKGTPVVAHRGGPCQAPHVFTADGDQCWGNVGQTVQDLIARYEYPALVSLVINFLQSVNVDDGAGAYVNKWPVADKEQVRVEREKLLAEKTVRLAAERAEYETMAAEYVKHGTEAKAAKAAKG